MRIGINREGEKLKVDVNVRSSKGEDTAYYLNKLAVWLIDTESYYQSHDLLFLAKEVQNVRHQIYVALKNNGYYDNIM